MQAQYPVPQQVSKIGILICFKTINLCTLQYNEWRDISLDEKINDVLNIILKIRSIIGNVSKKLNPEGNYL